MSEPASGKEFGAKDALTVHYSAVHLHERPHECPHCDEKFTHKQHLKTQLSAAHLRERLHECPECEFKSDERASEKFTLISVFQYVCNTPRWKSPLHCAIHAARLSLDSWCWNLKWI